MKDYLLILRDEAARWPALSPEEQQAVIARFNDWNRRLRAEERLVSAGKLTQDPGCTLRRRDEQLAVDGPFSEAKETLTGFYVLRAEDADAARRWAADCPLLDIGGSVELRELAVLIGAEERPDR